jgi:prevent-host-death family protein
MHVSVHQTMENCYAAPTLGLKIKEDGYYGFIVIAIMVLHNMKSVNIAELKNRLSQYLNEVKAGHELIVRDRNTPVARIVPIGFEISEDEELRALAAEGKIRLGKEPVDDSFWDLPAPRVSMNAVRKALKAERDGS